MNCNSIKFPLCVLKILKLCLFCLLCQLILVPISCLVTKSLCIGSGLDLNVLVIFFIIFYVSIIEIIMPSLKGIKEKCLLGDNPTLLPTVFVCSHDYATVVIMFYCFCFNKVPSKAFGIVWMIVDSIMCKNINFCTQSRNFEN